MNVRVVTFGEALGLIRVVPGESFARASAAAIDVGGAEANVAIGLARLGVSSAWLGRVGADALGQRIERELRGEGVETHVVIDPESPTALMLKQSPRPDRTRVSFYRSGSAGSRLTPSDLDHLAIDAASWLHVTGLSLAISPSNAETLRAAIGRARAAGASVSFDVNHRASLWKWDDAIPFYRDAIAASDVVFASDDEFAPIVGGASDPRSLAEAVAQLGPKEVVVKCGAAGAGVLRDGVWEWADALRVRVIDTVGAGDAFVAGYLSIRTSEESVRAALDRAVRTGAAACETAGDWDGALWISDLRPDSGDPVRR